MDYTKAVARVMSDAGVRAEDRAFEQMTHGYDEPLRFQRLRRLLRLPLTRHVPGFADFPTFDLASPPAFSRDALVIVPPKDTLDDR